MLKNRKGRPTEYIVSVLDNQKNAITFTGTVSDFVNRNFEFCNEDAKKNAKSAMYQSMKTGCSAFGGKIRVLKNMEF